MAAAPTPAVLRHLRAATDQYPLDRKLLVCTSMGEGRELLRALAGTGSWIGWEITTPRRFALDLAGPGLAARGIGVADAYEEQAAVDSALDEAVADGVSATLGELAETAGFRQAMLNAVEALRLAGVDADRVRAAPGGNAGVRSLAADVLAGYQAALDADGLIDTAAVLRRAVDRLGDGPEIGHMYLVPGLSLRGATGRLVSALLERGAVALRADPVAGLEPPAVVWEPASEPAPLSGLAEAAPVGAGAELELFAASGPAEEIREVLRRVMAAGLQWDEVEIVTPDPVVYGGALHVVAERLGIPVSYAVGLPVERTRPGRATTAYFRWIQEGYPADELRRLLEAGDLDTPDSLPGPQRVARRLRQLRIGWGHDRYLPAIDRALDRDVRPRRHETPAEAEERAARERAELDALRSIIAPVLAATPRLDPDDPDQTVSPAELATGLLAFLEHVAAADDPSATARERLSNIAGRVAATLDRPLDPAAAMALLRRHLEIRVPAPQREGAAPWISAGGHVHLSDVEHGGYSGRPATFVVGLDADRFPGAGLQDPLLLDTQRKALDPQALPTSADRLAARRFALAACLARLRGRVTLSYSAWEPTEARGVAPSSVMLEAFRAASGRPEASFEELQADLGDAASPIARTGAIDRADLWFHALEEDGILGAGVHVVRAAYPDLDAGIRASDALTGDEATAYHGVIDPRPETLDPRHNPDRVLSASGLEALGSCGLRYFYRYVLRVRPPDDPELDPDVWLNALDRGSLLHTVFETTLAEARDAGVRAGEPAFTELALDVLDREARFMARRVPPPGEAVRRREMRDLRADVRSFAHMVEGADDRWTALELKFGLAGEPPAPLELKGGTVRLRGAIDRVDETDQGLVVIDYKTGSTGRYERRHGTFNGGRRLQNAVYALTAEWALDSTVARMEYHFPTWRGQNEVIRYSRAEVRRGRGLIDRLLDAVAGGRFLPTEEPDDCRFCDYKPICRHHTEGWKRGWETPMADWAAERYEEPAFRERRETRAWEDTFLAELDDGEAS